MTDSEPENLQQDAPLEKPKRRFFIDTDPGTDDAVALVMALRSPEIEVVGISVVAGNVGLEQDGAERAVHRGDLRRRRAGVRRRQTPDEP
ncbi:MAG: hypothetical protein HND48_18245 [Chloroflexi bacterium]|nr:hypothetical protein [Chloroflexota bacterium]